MCEPTKADEPTAYISVPTLTTDSTSVPRKPEAGFCDKHNVKHSWAPGPTLTSNPGWATRRCVNCGKGQRKSLAEQPWLDE